MVFFFIQVLVLIRQATLTEKYWLELDNDYRRPESTILPAVPSTHSTFWIVRMWRTLRHSNGYCSLLPFFRSARAEREVDRVYFKALRDEFILDRDMDHPPFTPVPPEQRLSYDFVFGRYLGLCLIKYLARVVDVTNTTLILLAIGTIVFYAWSHFLLDDDPILLSWSWLGLGWLHLLFNVYFEKHVLSIRHELVPEGSPHLLSLSLQRIEDQDPDKESFKSMSSKDISLPGWCSIDLDRYLLRRSWLKKVVVGGKPNRQDTLYWMDRLGPTIYLILIQSNMIFIGIDFTLQFVIFLPTMYVFTPIYTFIIYSILVLLSLSGNLLNKKHLVANVAVICSVGTHRNVPAIAAVFREQKTENLVRCFLILYRMRRFAFDVKHDPKRVTQDTTSAQNHYSQCLDPLEIMEVSKTFECFSREDGCMYRKEFGDLLITLGEEITPEILTHIMETMDVDSDGKVEKTEFLQWYAVNMVDENNDNALQNAPRVLFQLFDADNQGELTVSQLKSKLDALRVGFTIDEQIAIINEIDRNGSGSITLHEFELLFRKFPPNELLRRANKFEYHPGELLCNVVSCNAFV
jgi:Ca2+-binding EF-hand superfamily protein